ncbi:cytidylyltransferase domain-containing protein [Viridibacillus arvi]|uniref:cytidylyltransferase domain-containing protein n=1 Tax=Viridibacillus arvi TaxID=263475 RepID=UPI003CFEE510
MTVTAIIQARMGSTRLPGKILKEVNDKPLLAYQLERIAHSKFIDKIVIATTVDQKDDVIVEFCENNDVEYYRGSENDVLSRYYEAAEQFGGETIVRLTSDCPLIDPEIVDQTIQHFIDNDFDYVSNAIEPTYPRGLDVEVFTKESFKKVYEEATLPRDREHVTAYYYTTKDFEISSIKNNIDYSKHRWTVDTMEDFHLIKLIIENLYINNPLFTLEDIIELLRKHPEWCEINSHIEQKKI